MIIPSHVERMQAEAAELRSKLTALRVFIAENHVFETLSEIDKMLLKNQRKHMAGYLTALEMRIERAE